LIRLIWLQAKGKRRAVFGGLAATTRLTTCDKHWNERARE